MIFPFFVPILFCTHSPIFTLFRSTTYSQFIFPILHALLPRIFNIFYANISLFVAAWNMIHFISDGSSVPFRVVSCSNINNPFLHYFFVQLLLRSSDEANMFFNSVEGNLNSPSLMIFGQDNEFMKSLQFNKSVHFL